MRVLYKDKLKDKLQNKLKINFKLFVSFFLIIAGFNNAHIFSANEIKIKGPNISTDYLKKLPSNDYIIGPGDKLNIIVSRFYPELTSQPLVDGEGTIYIPKLNRVYVGDLTINELNDLLNKAYAEFVKYPDVEVEIINYRPIRIFVEGEVENPGLQVIEGSYSLSNIRNYSLNLEKAKYSQDSTISNSDILKNSPFFPTVFDAIRSSGGITQFSDLTSIQVIRKDSLSNGGGSIQTTINFQNVLLSGDNSQNIRVYDGDIIKVKKSNESNLFNLQKSILSKLSPKFLNVFVTGRVNRPGDTTVSKASTLIDAIDIAGGAKIIKGPVTFLRFNNDGSIENRKFSLRRRSKRGSYSNPYLRDGDLIIVGESFLSSTNQVINEFTSPFVGIFSTYGLIKAITD
ncbi:polysaccharide biosynthesis/export family protein [Prochlorococcus sp. AH-736-E20]|nr:polysaccharide biosynthesis/export family protein [Prochlorococcus sp. AH-736-E20]